MDSAPTPTPPPPAFRGLLVPVLCGGLLTPLAIFLHECGHYLAGRALGLAVTLHPVRVNYDPPPEGVPTWVHTGFTAGGPLTEVLMATAGYLVLRRRRRGHETLAPGVADWIATCFALTAGRWLRCLTGNPLYPQPEDEAVLSHALGLPVWVLPYALLPVAVVVLVAIIRLHPPGRRLVPFAATMLAGIGGAFVWARVVGPRLLG